jgi:putative ABC transport system ATP-binding protein
VTEAIATLAGVSRTFVDGERRRQVLRGVDLEIGRGEMVAIVGPSGCGKTTLLTILGVLDDRFEGVATLLGRRLAELGDDERTRLRNAEVGFVFQAFHLLDHLTVGQNVEVPLWLGSTSDPARAREVLELVGLADRSGDPVPTLSGGERQRIAIARAVVRAPRLLLADEPTGNLDRETGERIFQVFDRIRSSGCSVVVATHDPDLARRADRTLRLEDGRLA